jgi:hypothetical protein
MTTQEFSAGMDLALNSYANRADFGEQNSRQTIQLDEYEKSVVLTNAQEAVILSLYNGRNSSGNSLESTEELRRYLSPLIEERELSPITVSNFKGIDSSSKVFALPDNLWFITYESLIISNGKCESMTTMDVIPVRQDEYQKLRKNPFRGANDRRALRLDLKDNKVEIVCKYDISTYYVRYLRKLKPIILTDLDDQVIGGLSTVTECEVHESLHQKILELAVQMALQSRGYTREQNNNRE